jgi:DNA polymerase-3 subunit alpha
MADFVHLHVHSDYSLLDGACRHDELLKLAKSFGMQSVAVTDHGNLFGAMEFYTRALKAEVRPILGCEVYTVPGEDEDAHVRKGSGAGDYNHLLLLCESYEGWKNLQRLVSEGYRRGFYYKPRVSHHLLRKYAKGLIATSACLKGEVAQQIVRDRIEQAEENLLRLRDIFGENNLFVEVQENGLADQKKANRGLVELARKLSLPLVATADVHYLKPEDKKVQDVLVCINTGKLLADQNRIRMDDAILHFASKEEMAARFAWCPEALANTVAIAERCRVDLKKEQFGKTYFPKYEPPARPDGAPQTTSEFFRGLIEEGLRRRYLAPDHPLDEPLPAEIARAPLPAEVEARYREEITVIESMGFVPYFLIVWDFISWAKRNGIPVGPGRGSAAGSIIAYAIRITDIDPLEYDLLFERFLNKERVSLPDIDVDFCQERRGEVIEYVRKKYGRGAVAQIITFGTMAAKSVIRDVGRVMGIPLADVDKVAKLVPGDLQVKHKKLKDAFEEVPELAEQRRDPRFAELFSIAERLEGSVRNCSTHAAGVVIGDGPLEERVPLYVDRSSRGGGSGAEADTGEVIITQFPMTLLENECGLVKMDFLGLKTLTVIKWCLDHIEKTTGRRPDLSAHKLPLRDPHEPSAKKLYELLCRGETKGVFQFESSGYRDLLVKLRPDGFEDIIALGAMYRPGPLGAGMVDAYVNRKHGREPVTYLHPLLEKVLATTYGCMLYQEQIMRITNVLAGFTLAEADSLRKAMGKKKPEVMAKYKGKFIEGAGKNGCSAEIAEKIWEQMEFFAGYGFNRSHSAAYGLVTFQTAWLKANYPAEFMAALLSSEVASVEKVAEYVEEAERMGIEILPPDVNESDHNFSVVVRPDGNRAIRYGLIAIRGLGEKAIQAILEARRRVKRFRSIFDLCAEVDTKCVNKAAIEALLKAGALRSMPGRRAQIAAVLERALGEGNRLQQDRRSGQSSIFDMFAGSKAAAPPPPPPLPDVPEWPEQEILQGEKETLGFYLTSHPLKKHRVALARYATASAKSLAACGGQEVIAGGMIAQVRARPDKKGNMMAFLTVEDLEGSFDAVVFSRVYEQAKPLLAPEAIVLLKGSVDTAREQPSVIVNEVLPIEKADEAFAAEVKVVLPRAAIDDGRFEKLVAALEAAKGRCVVVIEITTRDGARARIRVGQDLYVRASERLERDIEALLGPGAIEIAGAGGRRADRGDLEDAPASDEPLPLYAEAMG